MGNILNRRRRYIVKREFQLKYVGLILLAISLSVIISGYSIYYNSWVLLGDKLAKVYPQGRLVSIFRTVNIRLALNMVFVSLLCACFGILVSHRIAGPLYRIMIFLENVTKGDYSQRLTLRKKDELKDLADGLNKLVDKLDKEKKSP